MRTEEAPQIQEGSITRSSDPLALLRTHFGYNGFRPGQGEVIAHVLNGRDAVVLMPTGGGKSICYQVPALALPGLTVVVSPLIALMKDQVQALQANGISAAYLNSSLAYDAQQTVEERLREGTVKLLYVSPERLLSQHFLDRVELWRPSLFAIDEAHCISTWGHAFRPDYKQLHFIKERFPTVPMVALTATADKTVRSDIAEHLGMGNHRLFTSSFDRPNLSLTVLPGRNRWAMLQRILARHPGQCGIIYCNSRKGTEKVAAKLLGIGIEAEFYHAGMEAEERDRVQDEFIGGRTRVICATVAFGMGIDKGDVRFLVHWNMPGTLEGYYQEIGRAGRDGKPAETVLFYSYGDVLTHERFIAEVDDDQYKTIMRAKLERMKAYAEAQVCRRIVLLSYFSEEAVDPCGNCDVCKAPPKYINGTVEAQKALSAITRCGQKAGMRTLVDVLKGIHSEEVLARGFNHVKTFGVGGEHSVFAWQLYLQQFLQQGLVEVAYKEQYHLQVTALGHRVLQGLHTVQLVSADTVMERQAVARKSQTPPKRALATDLEVDQELFQHLRELRTTIAKQIHKPAYLVFNDASLRDMAARKPRTVAEFLEVSGVGEHKARLYANRFLGAIKTYLEA